MKVDIRASVSYSGLIIMGGGGGEAFLHFEFGGIYMWRGLFSEFYSKLCEVCFKFAGLCSEIKIHESLCFLG